MVGHSFVHAFDEVLHVGGGNEVAVERHLMRSNDRGDLKPVLWSAPYGKTMPRRKDAEAEIAEVERHLLDLGDGFVPKGVDRDELKGEGVRERLDEKPFLPRALQGFGDVVGG